MEKIVTEIQYREVRVEIIKEVAAKEREGELVLPLLQPQLRAKPARASRSNEVRI